VGRGRNGDLFREHQKKLRRVMTKLFLQRTQFFNMAGSTEKPLGTIRNITVSNVKVKTKQFAVLNGNATDKVSNSTCKNVEATAETAAFPNRYSDVKFDNVTLNSAPLKSQTAQAGQAVTPLKPD
jgi:hypothetical protein